MSGSKSAESTLSSVAENLQQMIEGGDTSPNVILARGKMDVINEYVLLFVANFSEIIDEYDLTKSEIRVIFRLLKYMRFGNLISLSNSALTSDLGMDTGNLSRIMKRLRGTELIVEFGGGLFFNPHVVCKGSFDRKNPKDAALLDYAAIELAKRGSKATPSLGTRNIRRKCAGTSRRWRMRCARSMGFSHSAAASL